MAALTFDPIAIADIGSNPRKLAAEIVGQTRAHFSELPLPLPLTDIARGLGISEVVEHDSTNFLGILVTTGNRSAGIISLQKGLQPGRWNFTLGHEIGHMVSLHHKAPPEGFKCAPAGMKMERTGHVWKTLDRYQRMEIEANEFSAAVLIPPMEYGLERSKLAGVDLAHIETLRTRFGVSKEAMVRAYIHAADDDLAVVFTQHGRFRKCVAKSGFPHLGLRSGVPMPAASLTTQALGNRPVGYLSEPTIVQPEIWLDPTRAGVELTEQVFIQRDGWALTMLALERPDDEGDDDLVEKAWAPPAFAHGR